MPELWRQKLDNKINGISTWSRKDIVELVHMAVGRPAAEAVARELKLNPKTVKAWLSTWRKEMEDHHADVAFCERMDARERDWT
jgi:hypothetical protein